VPIDLVRNAYANRATEYIDALGSIENSAQTDRDYLLGWARSVDGRLLDVGCGPGQWTNFFHEAGVDVEGLDPVEEFIHDARTRYPTTPFRGGRAQQLDVASDTLGGILAWFSLIHLHPRDIGEPLNEFARAIKPGGSLAVGFFDGPAREPFNHAVATAYYWSVESLTEELEKAGFSVFDAQTRHDPGVRRQGVIVAHSPRV